LIAWLVDPIMPVISGLVADYGMEPAMRAQTGLSNSFGWLVGTSPGSGMSLQFIVSGFLYLGIIALAWFIPVVRNVETILPDHDQKEKVAVPVSE
jgi:hypothetical protein